MVPSLTCSMFELTCAAKQYILTQLPGDFSSSFLFITEANYHISHCETSDWLVQH